MMYIIINQLILKVILEIQIFSNIYQLQKEIKMI